MVKEDRLIQIINELFALDSPKLDVSRKDQITNFVVSAVNGDNPTAHLVLNANLGENNKGAIAYILTDLRLIKIDIDSKEIQSNSYRLSNITGVERKLIDGDLAQFSVSFQNGTFGLKYSTTDQKITDFFQKIDLLRED